MFVIYLNDNIIHHPRMFEDGYQVIEPTLDEIVNGAGTLNFTVPETNPLYDSIKNRKSYVTVENEHGFVWRGRVMSSEKNWRKELAVYCEGDLAFLNDSIQRPFAFNGTPAQLFSMAILAHNQQVDAERQFTIGRVTVTDPNNYIVRSSEYPMTTWEFMRDKCFESSLGGYIRTRTENGVHYIDYLASFDHQNTQQVSFGQNLIDIAQFVSAEDVITCLVPYGARLEDDDPNHEDEPSSTERWNGNRLTIKDVNDQYPNEDYIKNQTGISLFGEVWGYNIWDDVTVASNLLSKAKTYLSDQIADRITISCSALDLSILDYDAESIKIGDLVEIYSIPHNIDIWLMCREKTTPFMTPGDSSVVFGAETKSLTDLQVR